MQEINASIKQRLIGAITLLVVAALLWPFLFDFNESHKVVEVDLDKQRLKKVASDNTGKSPEPRSISKITKTDTKKVVANTNDSEGNSNSLVQESSQSKNTGSLKSVEKKIKTLRTERIEKTALYTAEENTTADEAGNQSATPDIPSLDKNKVPVTYVVQVGVFKEWKNATRLKDKLVFRGHKAFLKPATPAKGGPYKLSVGPTLTLNGAKDLEKRLKALNEVNDTYIREY